MSNSEFSTGCPFPHALARRESPLAQSTGTKNREDIVDFNTAREVLRSAQVRQAGFMSEQAAEFGGLRRQPVLFAEGEEHHEMRRDTARYFTPTQVASYQPMIARHADELIARLAQQGQARIDDLSLTLAVRVASHVVGLTSSRVTGLERRVMAFVEGGGNSEPGSVQRQSRARSIQQQLQLSMFYFLDVKPAIEQRKRDPHDDLISHLLGKNYSDLEILTECLTYGTAGMVTTREFISLAAWHLLRQKELRVQYVHGSEVERTAILHEILRLEPVVSMLYRRVEHDLTVEGRHLPQGSLLAIDIVRANGDPGVVGEHPQTLCPARDLPRGVQAPVLSFGDGHHRCPGAYLAIKESDMFLRRLLMLNDLRVVREPTVTFNEVVKGYELRDFRVSLG